ARTRIVLYVASARPRITKAATPTIAHSGDVVTYTLTLRNETFGSLTMPLQDPHITDLLPTSLIYVDGSQAVTSRPIGAPDPAFEVLPNFNNSGRSLLRWRWSSYSLAAGQTMTVQFRVRIAPYTVAGTISNNAYLAGWGNQPSNILTTSCVSTSTDSQDFDSDGNSQEQICNSGTTNISLAAAASSGSLKLVKGQLDSTWSYDPSHGYTVPGGRADYQLTITNTGSIAISELTLLDILPWVGDVGVKRFNDPRQSEWRPFLAQPIEVPSGASVFYSTQNNPCRAPDLGIDPTNDSPSCSTPIWFSEPPTDISTVQSFKINFGNLVLQPSDAVTILVHLQAPYGGTVGEIAWNSFGYRARAVGSTEYLLAPEPPRVGIERQEAYPPGYGDYVWLDRNQNGLQDVGETGLNGVRVELFRDSDGILGPSAGDTFIAAKSTGPDDAGNPGYYIFNESFASSDPRYPGFLPPGNYYSRVVPPPGSRIAPQNIGADDTIDSDADPSSGYTAVTNLIAGEVDQTWDTGLIPSTAVGNYVWIDRNENGLQDDAPGDGVNGVTVRLYRSDGTLIRTTLTQDDNSGRPGYYLFDGLMAGDYYVEFVRPSSFASFTSQASGNRAQDSDASPTTGRTSVFSLGENQYDDTRDAGLILTSGALRLGNQVWRDLNNDGLFTPATGEYGIDNVSISLYRDSNNNSVADAGENVGNTTTSTHMGQAGWYQFSNLAAGNYIAVIDASNFAAGGALAGMRSSTGNEPTPDPDNNVDNDDNGDMLGGRVVSKQITVSVNGEPSIAVDGDDANGNQTLDFGVINGASLGNVVWFDTNSNGQQDSGEPGVAGVTVELLDNGSNVLRTTTTDQNGRYGFSELSGGSYQVRFGNLPVGYSFTTSNTGSDASDSDPDPTNGTTTLIALTDNQIDLTWDAGLVASVASIGDRVWADLNHDGLQDAAEPGVNGVTVTLYRSNGLQIATTTTSTVAGADGSYSFTNLPPGNYYIVFSNLPSGYAVSPQNIGSDDTLDSDADSATRRTAITTLAPGENDSSWDLGIFAYASIGNYVWYDTNHDGVQDATESGVPNVTVRLY
ncbi:MAG: DUF11 domain-containing protein, partial [Oscillochloris sp.]|nr:DUF11 domain-containing protein [Oscillochloris sp.]